MTGNLVVDWLFMLSLLGVGVGLLLGIFMKLSTFFSSVMLGLMYLAGSILLTHNPLIDEHIVYIIAMAILCLSNSDNYLGLSNWWNQTKIVQKHTWLR